MSVNMANIGGYIRLEEKIKDNKYNIKENLSRKLNIMTKEEEIIRDLLDSIKKSLEE